MFRTQISLDEREYELAKRAAEAMGVSVADVARHAVQTALALDEFQIVQSTRQRSGSTWAG